MWVRPRKGPKRDIGLKERSLTNEGMSDRPFHACFEAEMRFISHLKIKI